MLVGGCLMAGAYLAGLSLSQLLLYCSALICLMAGAYLAGLSLSQLPYRREIETKISSLQTFGMTLFYLMLGIYFRYCVYLLYWHNSTGLTRTKSRRSEYVSIRQHTSAYASIRQHTSVTGTTALGLLVQNLVAADVWCAALLLDARHLYVTSYYDMCCYMQTCGMAIVY